MVEKVARSLFLAEHPGSEWSAGRARVKWFYMAEAAIQAMREPTEEMTFAGSDAGGEPDFACAALPSPDQKS